MAKSFFLMIGWVLLWAFPLLAQVSQTAYTEVKIESQQGNKYKVIPVRQGVLAILDSEKRFSANQREMRFTYYDTALQVIWNQSHFMDDALEVKRYAFDGDTLFMLMLSHFDRYRVLRLHVPTGDIAIISLQETTDFEIIHFHVHQGRFLFGGKMNGHPAVLMFDYHANRLIALSAINQLKADLAFIQVDTLYGYFHVVMTNEYPPKRRKLYYNRYTLDGKLEGNYAIARDPSYSVLTYRPMPIPDGLRLFGTYALKGESMAQGIYVMDLQPGQIKATRFYDFSRLKRFFDYMPEKKRARHLARIEKKSKKSKGMVFRYFMQVHDLRFEDDKILFFAESGEVPSNPYNSRQAFFPNQPFYSLTPNGPYTLPAQSQWTHPYHTRNRSRNISPYYPQDPFNMPGIEPRPVHGIVAAFDSLGKLIWDNSYTFDPKWEKPRMFQALQFCQDGDSVVFVQQDNRQIRYSVAAPGKPSPDEVRKYELRPLHDTDNVHDHDQGIMMHWYANHFITYGFKDIRNRSDNKLNRDVFYLSKLSYQPVPPAPATPK